LLPVGISDSAALVRPTDGPDTTVVKVNPAATGRIPSGGEHPLGL
jgi:hypothetical protein